LATRTQALPTQESLEKRAPMLISQESFDRDFNRKPIAFDHTLAEHPAFSMDRLTRLVELTLAQDDKIFWDAGEKSVGQRWDERPGRDFSIQEAMRRIEHCGAWIVLFGAERDPEIAALLASAMAQVNDFSGGSLLHEAKVQSAYIFITSPRRVTPFHIDRECNFLMQIHGSKTIHIFDQNDREVLSETELEKFWTVDNNAPVYKPALQNRALTLNLNPGQGVHIPVNAPHWVQNHDSISVSLSLNFQFKNTKLGNIYRANYYLRKLGMNPTPPRRSWVLDKTKAVVMQGPVVLAKTALRLKRKKNG
jgi:Cupin-like domain